MDLFGLAKRELAALILRAHAENAAEGLLPSAPAAPAPPVAPPKEASHGDLASAWALVCAKALRLPPAEIAQKVVSRMELGGSMFRGVEAAPNGFINAAFAPGFYTKTLETILDEGASYGRAAEKTGRRVLVEFVSANPTGPMTVGNARGGVLGDTLAACLEAAGHEVRREFYLNDAGHQVDAFARSIECRYLQAFGLDAPMPDDGYMGEYIAEYARGYIALHGDTLLPEPPETRRRELAAYALPLAVDNMRRDLERYRVRFDRWFAESELHAAGDVEATVAELTRRGRTYEKDGALWLTAEGWDKDEVLRRANGFYTYFASDLAYHRDKYARGYHEIINIFGADHHGHTLRFPAALRALGLDSGKLRFVVMQLVSLTRGGEAARMSKRTGKAVTLADLLDEIGPDAARFFFNMRRPDNKLDFDLDLAVRHSADNPVYYVQYAHARICTLLNTVQADPDPCAEGLTHAAETAAMRLLAAYPEEVALAASQYEPSGINRYLMELAAAFHRFYDSCRLASAPQPLKNRRAALCACVRQTLANGLGLLGVTAPEKM
ncbi:MAG: arginine--tRNA ligase [Oscillospiraceae bacterium]|jgi:arginyl-tRNA synthetase|nr:arginine--tRNA ligase [Oscillospiraceae bacterium]